MPNRIYIDDAPANVQKVLEHPSAFRAHHWGAAVRSTLPGATNLVVLESDGGYPMTVGFTYEGKDYWYG